jgi:hypothetical protein
VAGGLCRAIYRGTVQDPYEYTKRPVKLMKFWYLNIDPPPRVYFLKYIVHGRKRVVVHVGTTKCIAVKDAI